MPRRLILSATERDTLLALPESQDDLIRYYTFNDSDLSLIRQRRGDANRLGFAVQLCLLRYPGYALGTDSELPEPVILWVAKQVQAEPASWAKYGERDVTRREHAQELRTYLQLAPFGVVCGRGRNPTLRLWPTIFSGKIDVFPGDRRSRLISSMTSVAPA